jgi:membrane-associated phospholipid phosphatase
MCTSNRFLKGLIHPITIVIILLILACSYLFFDQTLAVMLAKLNLSSNFPVLGWITFVGSSKIYLIGFFLMALFFRWIDVSPRWEARSWFLWLCVAVANLICGVLKVLLGRARPEVWLQTQDYGFHWFKTTGDYWSFPSGHTTTVMSLVFGLSVLFPRYWVGLVSAAILIALSRVLLVQHFLSDILMATYLALIEVTLLVHYLRKKNYLAKAW